MNSETKYYDEEILEMCRYTNEKMRKKQLEEELNHERVVRSIGEGKLTFDDQTIEFKEISFFDGQVCVKVPKDFVPLPELVVREKYPISQRPDIIYSSEKHKINLTLKRTELALTNSSQKINEEEMLEFTNSIINMYKKANPSVKIDNVEVKEVNGSLIGMFDFLSLEIDWKIYNIFMIFILHEKVVFATFNCIAKDMEIWKPIGYGLIEHIRLLEDSNFEK